jgi:hypothetical protein
MGQFHLLQTALLVAVVQAYIFKGLPTNIDAVVPFDFSFLDSV